jgi:anti-sigma factor RsiW
MGALKAGCERAREWVSLDVDGGLSQLEAALLGSHLERCPACAAYASSVRALTVELRSAPKELPALSVRPEANRTHVRLLAAVAVVVVAAGLGSLAGALSHSGSDAHPPAADLLAVRLPPSMAAPIPVRIGG